MKIILDDTPLPGINHRIDVQEQIARKDAGGETSATVGVYQGTKPAILTVTLDIREDTPEQMTVMQAFFRFRDEPNGLPYTWRIIHPLTTAMGIGQVQFTDFLRVSGAEKARLWNVQFTLIEIGSISARSEERAAVPATTPAQPPAGTSTASGDAPAATTPETQAEKLLHWANDWVGKTFYGGGP